MSDRGVWKSLRSEPLKTDGPLCVNFRRIKQGGYARQGVNFAKWFILCGVKGCRISPDSIEKRMILGRKTV